MNLKIKRNLLISFIVSLFIILSFCFISCDNKNADAYPIGVKNYEISVDEKSFEFIKDIIASDGTSTVEIDSSRVKLGVEGEYTVSYICGKNIVNGKIKIYGKPAVSAADVTMTYKEALEGNTKGIIAKDSFGNAVTIERTFSSKAGYYKFGGIYNESYIAKDKVGNISEFTRRITIEKQNEFVFDSVQIDLGNPIAEINNIQGDLVCVADEQGVTYTNVNFNNGSLSGLGEVASKYGTGNYNFAIVTTEGYGLIRMRITDDMAPLFCFDMGNEKTGIDNYIYTKGEEIIFPNIINKSGTYQKLETSYELTKDGKAVSIDNFDSNEMGSYVYTAVVNNNKGSVRVDNRFYIVSEKEKLNNLFSVNSNQFINNYQPCYDVGSSLEYVGEIADSTGKKYNAAKFFNNVRGGHQRTLRFNTKLLEQIIASGSTTVSMEIMLAEEFTDDAFCYIFAYNGYWTCSVNRQYSISSNKWTKVTFDLSNCWVRGGVPDLYTTDYFGNISVFYTYVGIIIDPYLGSELNQGNIKEDSSAYVANVVFGCDSTYSEKKFYDFGSGDSITLYDGGMNIDIAGNEVVKDNITILQNGVVKEGLADSTILSKETIADITDNILTYNKRAFVAFDYDSGEIFGTSDVKLSGFGDYLEDYGCGLQYSLYTVDGIEVKNFDSEHMTANNLSEGGYIQKLIVSKQGNFAVFNKYFYVFGANSKMAAIDSEYLYYRGKDGTENVFEMYISDNRSAHRKLTFNADYVAKMLDEGKTSFSITFKTGSESSPYQQIYRIVDDAVTFSGENGRLLYSVDYYNVAPILYDTYITVTFSIDESMRGKNVGFTVTKNALISDIVFE